MNSQEAFDTLKTMFARAPQEGRRTDVADEFRTDHATGLSLADIEETQGSSELKHLLKAGLQLARGEMTIIVIHHEATEGKDGRFIYELAGQPEHGPRIGTELIVFYTKDGQPMDIKVLPSSKLMGTMSHMAAYEGLFNKMIARPHEEVVRDAGVMLELGAKALKIDLQ